MRRNNFTTYKSLYVSSCQVHFYKSVFFYKTDKRIALIIFISLSNCFQCDKYNGKCKKCNQAIFRCVDVTVPSSSYLEENILSQASCMTCACLIVLQKQDIYPTDKSEVVLKVTLTLLFCNLLNQKIVL